MSAANKLAGEMKYVDDELDRTAITDLSINDSTWAGCELDPATNNVLPIPTQGTTYADRDGRKIFIKNIKIRGVIRFGEIANDTKIPPFVRLLVVKDTRTNGVQLSAEDVLGVGKGPGGTTALTADAAVMAFSNPNGWGRYNILVDKIIRAPFRPTTHDATTTSIVQAAQVDVPFKLMVKANTYVNFDASSGGIGDVIDNSFHLIGGASNSEASISYVCRTAFVG